jgi:23S rRNA (adenine2030-N6)-methyltransferase
MNYRHAFHAGNFADVLKHMVLSDCLRRLMVKDKGLALIDLFAGIGWYDLASEEAARSPEWEGGIARVKAKAASNAAEVPALVANWLSDTASALHVQGLETGRHYPGSPALMAAACRAQDRVMLCELHREDSLTLTARFKDDRNVTVHPTNGWAAIRTLVPPPTRRGLILIDPPFEQPGEFDRMELALRDGLERFATGTYLLWYACKDAAACDRWLGDIGRTGARCLDARLSVAGAGLMPGLLAAGIVVVNPPFGLEEALGPALDWLGPLLQRGAGAQWHVRRMSGVW